MLCQRCPQLREELQRTRDNVRLIEDLLEDARKREKTQDTLDRLAMLHKHCRTNYDDMANLTFALNHCQNRPRCPGQWNRLPNKNYELSHGWQKSRTPPIRGASFQRHVAGVCGRPASLKKMTLPRNDDVVRQDTWQVTGRVVSHRVLTHQWMI